MKTNQPAHVTSRLDGLRVAVVDDEDCVRKSLERLLRSVGIDAATFASGEEFLQELAQGFHCLVLDLHMPAMTGFDVHEQVRRSGAALPIVLVTGHETPGDEAKAAAAGVSDYLRKPIDERVLLQAIATAVNRARAAA